MCVLSSFVISNILLFFFCVFFFFCRQIFPVFIFYALSFYVYFNSSSASSHIEMCVNVSTITQQTISLIFKGSFRSTYKFVTNLIKYVDIIIRFLFFRSHYTVAMAEGERQ